MQYKADPSGKIYTEEEFKNSILSPYLKWEDLQDVAANEDNKEEVEKLMRFLYSDNSTILEGDLVIFDGDLVRIDKVFSDGFLGMGTSIKDYKIKIVYGNYTKLVAATTYK